MVVTKELKRTTAKEDGTPKKTKGRRLSEEREDESPRRPSIQ